MEFSDTLIIILSVGMSIILLLVIISLYYVIKILKSIRQVTEKAQNIADNVDTVSQFFKNSAGPAAVTKIIANIIETVKNREGSKK